MYRVQGQVPCNQPHRDLGSFSESDANTPYSQYRTLADFDTSDSGVAGCIEREKTKPLSRDIDIAPPPWVERSGRRKPGAKSRRI